ncbi:MAG: KaiC-like protein ATPase [Candidatus Methanohalarchaeum thermophilum]|uniref:KaiC-like protein ATPase n=1 Tax=Methanohalarchaeum thermophilum TaxID=1903181 RepID=A0A1Q6DW44_METT1|nr:MAG: KaiC-like protein ATPase [Candidatus Methanohalarchaeum thermophilum]
MKEYSLGIDNFGKDVREGTNILFTAPPLSGKNAFSRNFFYQGLKDNEGCVYVTTTEETNSILKWFKENKEVDLDEFEGHFGIVDCVTKSQELSEIKGKSIKYASNPGDLTDIGVKISSFLKDFYKSDDLDGIRLIIDTISVILMYSNVKTVFRFLHTFSGRIRSTDAVALYILEEGDHDRKTIQTLKQLVDLSLEAEESEGNRMIKFSGQINSDWLKYAVNNNNMKIIS